MKFNSHFSSCMNDMLEFKEALGHSRNSYEHKLSMLDKFLIKAYPECTELTSEIVFSWCNEGNDKSGWRKSIIRGFAKYLVAIGKEAYVLPLGMFGSYRAEPPYILSDKEISNFFSATDNYPSNPRCPLLEYTIPTIFRVQFACGLRPQEIRRLKCSDIDYKNKKIYINETKWCKDRVLPVTKDIITLCSKYNLIASRYYPERTAFFVTKDGEMYSTAGFMKLFNKCWILSGNENARGKCNSYDFRHNYATRTLMRWIEEDKDLNVYLPYLSTYMGHASFVNTFYYIHLLPEKMRNLVMMDAGDILPGGEA